MLQRLIARRLITPPAIWGKLPGHADFVRSGMRHGESAGWQPWLARQGHVDGPSAAIAVPAAFVLAPGTLSFARRCFVLGVLMPSIDKVGRSHALLVYQLAQPRWLEPYLTAQQTPSLNWQFWLARAVARHTRPNVASGIQAFEHTVTSLWQLHRPQPPELWSPKRVSTFADLATPSAAHGVLDRLAGPDDPDDPSRQLDGVRHFPLAGWPQQVFQRRSEGVFWQQDAAGAYVNVSTRLSTLWSGK